MFLHITTKMPLYAILTVVHRSGILVNKANTEHNNLPLLPPLLSKFDPAAVAGTLALLRRAPDRRRSNNAGARRRGPSRGHPSPGLLFFGGGREWERGPRPLQESRGDGAPRRIPHGWRS